MLQAVGDTASRRIPDAPPHLNVLERHLWYADRLREAGIPFNPGAEVEELSARYHSHYYADGYPPPEPDSESSWTPVKLAELPDKPPVQPTLGGIGLVYPGMRHVFSGPPESAKTLVAYALILEVVRTVQPVVLIDFEMGAYDARGRLVELGATPDDLNRVHYIEPDERATDDRIEALVQIQPALVVIDAAAGAYDLEALKDNDRGDVEKFSRTYVRRFWRAGIATIVIDHVVKDMESRGHYAIGSERKLGGTDVHLGFDTISPISRGTAGLYKITNHKDRGAWLKRGKIADVELVSDPDTHRITWAIKPAEHDTADTDTAPYFRPTHLMEKVSRYLELQSDPVTRNSICDALGGTKKHLLSAIKALIIEEFLTESEGEKRSRPVQSIRPYREAEDTPMVRRFDSGSAVVREPQIVDGSGGSPHYVGNLPEPNHSDHPQDSLWFGDLTYLESIAPDTDEPTS